MITEEELKRLLFYDKDTGAFTWKESRKGINKSACQAGSLNNGYVRIKINYRVYLAHRLAWFYVYGNWPKDQIDHINGIRSDNRIVNLREATSVENHRNVGIISSNSSGYRGVCFASGRGKWQAQCRLDKKLKTIGYFNSAKEASEAYESFTKIAFGEFYKNMQDPTRDQTVGQNGNVGYEGDCI